MPLTLHSLTKRNCLVNQVEFLELAHTFVTVTFNTPNPLNGYLSRDKKMFTVKCYEIITDLTISLVLTTFWGISPRNSTSFTRPSLTGRRARAGHETIQDVASSTSILTCGGGGRFLSYFEPPGASGAMEEKTFQRRNMEKFCANLIPRPLPPEAHGDKAGSRPKAHQRQDVTSLIPMPIANFIFKI